MKHLFLLLFTLIVLSSCTDDINETSSGNTDWGTTTPPVSNNAIDEQLFEVINLDYPGLEKVKAYYEDKQYYFAAQALLEYYRTRTNVINPNLSLINVTSTADDKLKADYALDNYRFFVNNYYEDAVSKRPYSLKKDGKIDWTFKPTGADDEYQKQLNRHQWFVPQAKVYRTSNNEKYIKSWIEVYTDWMKQNPMPETGTNITTWWQLQVAERIAGQVELLEYYKNSVNFTPQWLATFMPHFAQHADFLVKYPYEQGGNILVSQGSSLVLAGTLFPEFKNAGTWQSAGFNILNTEVKKQFLGDGMHFELDLSYHIAAIEDFYKTMKLAEANNLSDKLPTDFSESLRKATELVMHLTYPNFFDTKLKDYCVPGFNDTRQSSWSRSVLTKNFKKYAEMFPDNTELLYMATVGQQGTPADNSPKAFDQSGYYVLRNGWEKSSTMLVQSNNYSTEPIKIWSHNQPDNGTFELYHNGRNFFPDSGVFSYYAEGGDNSQRTWYRQTRVHNTMTLDGKNHIAAGGKLIKISTEGNNDILVTENQGYSNLKHRRTIFFVDKKFFVLVDEGVGNAEGQINLNFNLCEGTDSEVVLDLNEKGAHTAFADGNNLMIRSFSNRSISAEAFPGKVSYQPGVEASRQGYSVNMKKEADKVARFITVLYPVAGETQTTEISGKFIVGGYEEKSVSLQVTVNGKEYNLSYNI